MDESLIQEVSFLVLLLKEGKISDHQFDRLQHLLQTDQGARQCYVMLVNTELFLRESDVLSCEDDKRIFDFLCELAEYEKTAPRIEIPKEKPQRELIQKVVYPPYEKLKMSKFQIVTLVMSAAAILFFVLFAKFAPQQYSVEVATLVDQIGVKWADSTVDLQSGERLLTNQQPISLAKGVVKIQYDNGVNVVIEGPAAFEVERSGIYLEYGQLYSRVSETGLGFRVETPTSLFIDQGTEFGVQADINGSSELHVTKGKVQLFAGSQRHDKLSQLVTTDTAVSYNPNAHEIKSVPLKKHHFVSEIDSATKAVLRGYANRYQAAVAETRPAAWYRFEKGQDALGYDEISGTVTTCDYSEPVALAQGMAIESEPANQSLYLAGDAQSGIYLSDKAVLRSGGRALSISLWIRPEKGNSRQNVICYMNNQKRTINTRTNQIFIWKNNQVSFFVYNLFDTTVPVPFEKWDESQKKVRPNWLEDDKPLPLNQWSHVVACFSDKKMDLYVNGQLCHTRPISVRTECHKGGYWGIGCMTELSELPAMTGEPQSLNYQGGVDEICFYDRPLAAQEVQSLYEAAIPLQ